MKVKNHLDFCCFDYISSTEENKFELGDVVTAFDNAQEQGIEVGVVIQIHPDGDVRTDMFGNYHTSGLRLSTLEEIQQYYPKLLQHLAD
jgi:hypothetical protein